MKEARGGFSSVLRRMGSGLISLSRDCRADGKMSYRQLMPPPFKIVLLAHLIGVFGFSTPASTKGLNSNDLGRATYEAWTKIVRDEGKQELLSHPRNNVVAACIDWDRIDVERGKASIPVLQWWLRSEYDNPISEERAEVLRSCESWKTSQKEKISKRAPIDPRLCDCTVIAEGLNPLSISLGKEPLVGDNADISNQDPVSSAEVRANLVLQSSHAKEIRDAYLLHASSEHPVVITRSEDSIITWDLSAARELKRIPTPSPVEKIGLSTAADQIVTVNRAGEASLVDLATGSIVRSFPKGGDAIGYSRDGRLVFVGGKGVGESRLYHPSRKEAIWNLDILGRVTSAMFSGPHNLITVEDLEQITAFDTTTQTILWKHSYPRAANIVASPYDERVLVYGNQAGYSFTLDGKPAPNPGDPGYSDGFLKIIDSTGDESFGLALPTRIDGAAFLADGKRVLIFSPRPEVWDVGLSKVVGRFEGNSVSGTIPSAKVPQAWTLSEDGGRLYTAEEEGVVCEWDTSSGSLLRVMRSVSGIQTIQKLILFNADRDLFALAKKGGDEIVGEVWRSSSSAATISISRDTSLAHLDGISIANSGRILVGADGKLAEYNLSQSLQSLVVGFDGSLQTTGSSAQVAVDASGQPWDFTGLPRMIPVSHPSQPRRCSLARRSRSLACFYADGSVLLWTIGPHSVSRSLTNGAISDQVKSHNFRSSDDFWERGEIAISDGGEVVAVGIGGRVDVWNQDGSLIRTIQSLDRSHAVVPLAISPDRSKILLGGQGGSASAYEIASGTLLGSCDLRFASNIFSWDGDGVRFGRFVGKDRVFALSENEQAAVCELDGRRAFSPTHEVSEATMADNSGTQNGEPVSGVLTLYTGRILSFADSSDGNVIYTGGADGKINAWDSITGNRIAQYSHNSAVSALAVSSDGRLIVSAGADGSLHLWAGGKEGHVDIGSLALFHEARWAAVTADGRFDTNEIANINSLGWVVSDSPWSSLRPEIFMRDYYEPRLLPRLLACNEAERTGSADACTKAFKPVRSLAELNRIQPNVRISSVQRGASTDEVLVHVEVEGNEDLTQRNGKTRTGVYDFRLFRDGELVGQWPEAQDGSDEIQTWRQRTLLEPGAGAKVVSHGFAVKLPTRAHKESILFTAYAFNEDRVKSATASLQYVLPRDLAPREARAYVVTVGANSYDAKERQLRFAVRDAEAMRESLSRLGGYKVVPISLTSDGEDRTKWDATKANIRAVLSRLAGQSTPSGSLAGVKGVDQLARATPDDVVIVTFSGHGYTAKDGAFYLLPSDSGKDLDPATKPEVLTQFISGEELSEWLRPIDAGQMAMIIDACHSAASVDQPGFKPGPMGDRGLGQLAYDKAMRILAASQADDVALESNKLKQGLLTYALVHDGLALGPYGKRAADANHDGKITIAEWLRYGEQHTPSLFEDIRAGRKDASYVGRDSVVEPGFRQKVADHAQTPALFDFAREDPVAFQP